jgi:hypothetical protein
MEQLPAVERPGRSQSPYRESMPRVDVRVVLFTVRNERLLLALQQRRGCQSLPRRDPTFNESLAAAAMHILDDEMARESVIRSSSTRSRTARKAIGP